LYSIQTKNTQSLLSSRLKPVVLMPKLPEGTTDKRFFSFQRLLRTMIIILLLTYSSMLQSSLSMLSCVHIGHEDVLADAPSIVCSGARYEKWK